MRRLTIVLAAGLAAACSAPRGMRAELGPPMELGSPVRGTVVVVAERALVPDRAPAGPKEIRPDR